jgi:hypothetical protein
MPMLHVAFALFTSLAAVAPDTTPRMAAFAGAPYLPTLVQPVARFEPALPRPAVSLELQRPQAVEFSDFYYVRLKVHQLSSFLTLPLFVAQFVVGEKLYADGAQAPQWARDAHGPLAAGIAGLFVVNSATGLWNLVEGWKAPAGRTRRAVHGVLMLIADAGFIGVGATAPELEEGGGFESGEGNRSLHQGLAIGSMSVALVSYAMMYLWKD